jgi:hypothetical protein
MPAQRLVNQAWPWLIEPKVRPRVVARYPATPAYGTSITIDKEPLIRSTFSTCFANGCKADFEATPELVDKLKKGQMLQIQGTYLGLFLILRLPLAHSGQNIAARLNPKEIIPHDFAGANEGPPTDPMVFEKQQPKRCNLDTFYWCHMDDFPDHKMRQ